MTHAEHIAYCAARVPGKCPVPGCFADPTTGNGWYCAGHLTEVRAMIDAVMARERADRKARRRPHRDRSFAEIVAGKARARETKRAYLKRKGWL